MKATSGITRCRGMTQSQRTRWLLSMPTCAEVNSAMQELTDNYFTTSEQHKDMIRSRQMRDGEGNNTLSHWGFTRQDPLWIRLIS